MVAPPENLELWHESNDGIVTHIAGGQFIKAEGIALAYQESGTDFSSAMEAPFDTIYQSAAFQVGGSYNGTTEDMFEFALVFNVYGGDNFTYRQAFTRFRNCLSSKEDSYLHARIQGVSHRKLTVRLKKTSNFVNQIDPNGMKFGQVKMFFVGAYPRWVEQDWTDEFVAEEDTTGAGIAAPTVSTPTTVTTGGTLAAGTYYYKVTATLAGNETAGSNEVSEATTGSTSKNTLTWGAASGADGYKVYRGTASGGEHLLATLGAVTTYTDTGTATTSPTVPSVSTIPQYETGYLKVWNPTNTLCWLRYMAQAGNANIEWTISDFSWGSDAWNRADEDSGRMIIMPELLLGENIKIDTNPYAFGGQVVSSLDTQVYLRMNGVQFLYPVPPRTPPTLVPVQVTNSLPGNGIKMYCPHEWLHPWGGE